MSSEREIDDYINELEEKNEVYVDKEVEYANKCHKLEEEIGCPFADTSCGSIETRLSDFIEEVGENTLIEVKNEL